MSLLYRVENQLMNELRHERAVQQTRMADPPEGALRLFLCQPVLNHSADHDEEKGDPIIVSPGMVYIVKAVTKPSENRETHEMEFGVQRRHIRMLKEVLDAYQAQTVDKLAIGRVYWYIEKDGQYRYLDLEAIDVFGRVIESENIHGGGTIFIQVHKTVPMRDYPNDPYRVKRDAFLSGENPRPEETKWFT